MCAPYFQDIGFACELSGSQKETSNHCRRNMHRFLLIGLFLTLLYQQSGAYVHPHEQKNAGSSAAAKIRKNDKGLTHLFIPRTKIGDAGAKSIAEALQENKYLNHLDLGGNNITDEGAVALAKALEINRSIEWLDLSHNDIGDFGAEAFLKTIKNNRNLTQLNLYENPKIHDDNLFAINYCLLDDEECKDLHSWSSEKLKAMAIAYHRDTDYHRHRDDIDEPNAVQHNEM